MGGFDVVIPCYNYGHFLTDAVRSVQAQSIEDWRILIIDDCSSDNSLAVARKLAAEDSRISLRVHGVNKRHIATYNEGIDWAEKDYFLLLSADDMLVPGSFERARMIMDENPDIVLTYGIGVVWKAGAPKPIIDPISSYRWSRVDIVRDICAAGGNVVVTPTAIGRTVTQKEIGGYTAALPHSADMEMWLRYGARGMSANIHAVQAVYRMHASNMSHGYNSQALGDFRERKTAFDLFFESCSPFLNDPEALRRMAANAFAEEALSRSANLIRRGLRRGDPAWVKQAFRLAKEGLDLTPERPYRTFLAELVRLPGARKSWLR